jgi:hypothetical protein
MFIFIYGLFQDSVNSCTCRYVVSNYRYIRDQNTEKMWKGVIMAQSEIPCRYFPVVTVVQPRRLPE